MKEELKKIIEELHELINEKKLNILDKDLLEFALKIYITESINKQKIFYPKTYPNKVFPNQENKYIPSGTSNKPIKLERQNASPLISKDELPTEKQIKAMNKLGLTIPAGATKKDVWKIMNERK